MATHIENPGTDTSATASGSSLVRTGVLVLTIILCSACCGLMLMLNPRSLAVDSVYQGF